MTDEQRLRDAVMQIVRDAMFATKLPVAAKSKGKLWDEIERRLAEAALARIAEDDQQSEQRGGR